MTKEFLTKELMSTELMTKEFMTKLLTSAELMTKEVMIKELRTKELMTKELMIKELITKELTIKKLCALSDPAVPISCDTSIKCSGGYRTPKKDNQAGWLRDETATS